MQGKIWLEKFKKEFKIKMRLKLFNYLKTKLKNEKIIQKRKSC